MDNFDAVALSGSVHCPSPTMISLPLFIRDILFPMSML